MTTPRTTALLLTLLAGCADHDDDGLPFPEPMITSNDDPPEGSSTGEESSSSTGDDTNVRPSMGTFSRCWDGYCDPHFRCFEGKDGGAFDLCVWEDCDSDDECPEGPGGQKGVCTTVGDSEELWDTCMLACPSQSDAGCPKDMRCIELDTWVCV